MTEDEIVGWYHLLDGHDGRPGMLQSMGHKELDKLYLNNNLITAISSFSCPPRLLTKTSILTKPSGSFSRRW